MAKPIGTRDSAIGLSEIIDSAKSTIVLVTPYVQLSYSHKRKLSEASEKGKQILLVCRKNELYPNQLGELERIPNLKLLDHANVHAKCYFNESKLLITSLNFYDHSIQNNVELGTWFDNTESQDKFSRALADAISALNIPELNLELAKVFGKNEVKKKFDRKAFEKTYQLFAFQPLPGEKGFCIRCASQLHYMNGNYPLCSDCFVEWSHEYDFQAAEKCCHWCGTAKAVTKAKPLCYSCFTKYREVVKKSRNQPPDIGAPVVPASGAVSPAADEQDDLKKEIPASGNSTAEEPAKAEASPPRNGKILLAIAGGMLITLVTIFWTTFNSDEPVISKNDSFKHLIKSYYTESDQHPENVASYFAPNVERYISAKNLEPEGVVQTINESVKEFSYPKTVVYDSTFEFYTDSLGRAAVSFWIDFECFRRSMKQYEKCRVKEEIVFDSNDKIVSVRELKVEDLKFSFKDPQ